MLSHRNALARALLIACAALVAARGANAEWEWEAVYDVTEADEAYSLNLAAAAADTTMKFCVYKTTSLDSPGIEAVEDNCNADAAINGNTITDNVAVATLDEGTTYQITMNANSWLSVFNVKFPSNGYYAMYTEHLPSEFYFTGGTELELLKDAESHDVAAAWRSDYDYSVPVNQWRNTMVGCLAVWVVTLTGLFLIVYSKIWDIIKPYAMMFASGTLLATAFALVLYESNHLITGSDEGLASGRWTAMILAGFLTSPVIAILLKVALPNMSEDDDEDVEKTGKDLKVTNITDSCCDNNVKDVNGCETSFTNKNVRVRFLLSLIAGDFFHNFTDGVFIGAAFQCNAKLAWSIVGVTVAHEVPQELGDFAVLKTQLNFSTVKALLYNVISGSSVMLGGIVVMSSNVSDLSTGMLLAYGAGNYIYCATVHMFSQGSKSAIFDAKRLFAFAIGCIAIGLILLDHDHCTSTYGTAAGGDAHAGHAH
jgi:UTP--glucose-1-phosphate uridylyltransferase